MNKEEAIKWLTNEKWTNANNKYKKEWNEAFDLAIEALQADAVCKAHEEEHLTIVNRIKELQYAIAKTQTIVGKVVEAADAYKRGFEDAKRAYEIELARSADGELAELKPKFESAVPNCQKCAIKQLWQETEKEDLVAVVRCKDCRFWKNEHLCLVMSRYGSMDTKAEHYCSWGERREK